MTKKLLFSVPSITCITCMSIIDFQLESLKKTKKISDFSSSEVKKTIKVVVPDSASDKDMATLIKNTLDGVGFSCELVSIENLVTTSGLLPILEMEDNDDDGDGECNKNLNNEIIVIPQKPASRLTRMHRYIIKGILGIGSGAVIMAIMLSGLAVTFPANLILVLVSSVITLLLGRESYWDAAKKLFKAGTRTMDTLFAISTLTAMGVSFGSLAVSWLGCMGEVGPILWGFENIGKAIQESLNISANSSTSLSETGAGQVLKRYNYNNNDWRPCDSVRLIAGNTIRVRKGDIIPVDGICKTIKTSIIKRITNGSDWPEEISVGEQIISGMQVPDHVDYIEMQVARPLAESYLSHYDRAIEDAESARAPIQETAQKILNYFIPAVIIVAVLAGIVIGVLLHNPVLAIQCITLLFTAACPCALGAMVPNAVKIGMSKARKHGVNFKTPGDLEKASTIDTVVLDLNGTLTKGKSEVVSYSIYDKRMKKSDFYSLLAAMEKNSKHHVAKAIRSFARDRKGIDESLEANKPRESHGGIKAKINNKRYLLGNSKFLEAKYNIPVPSVEIKHQATKQIIYLVEEEKVIGHVELKDTLREEARFVRDELKRMGKKVYICSGSNADLYREELGLKKKHVISHTIGFRENQKEGVCHTRSKADVVQGLLDKGRKVAFIGDSENDGLAITKSTLGFAIKSPTGSAETQNRAGVIVDSLLPVLAAFSIADQTVANIKASLALSFGYNAAFFLATIILTGLSIAINPVIGPIAMIGSMGLIYLIQEIVKRRQPEYVERYQRMKKLKTLNDSSYRNIHEAGIRIERKNELDNLQTRGNETQLTFSSDDEELKFMQMPEFTPPSLNIRMT